MNQNDKSPLAYTDNKPIGAADFYFAINATFRFILVRFGLEGLQRYWSDLGSSYFAPVSECWKSKGLVGVEEYWLAFFKAEPDSEVDIQRTDAAVTVDVRTCPAIHHLSKHNREIVPCFCQHCYFINEAIGASAGIIVRVEGGNGSCTQTFKQSSPEMAAQDMTKIKEASC
jgi:hypothetical protein